MPSLSIRLPLTRSDRFGFETNVTAKEVVQQNLKMILLTNPGERMMMPNFGVGLKRFLFEPLDSQTFAAIKRRANQQIEKYLPYINDFDIQFTAGDDPTALALNHQFDSNAVTVKITYRIPRDSALHTMQVYI